MLMLSRIDLNFQLQRCLRINFGREFEDQMQGVSSLSSAAFTKPGQDLSNSIDGRSNWLCLNLYQIDIF